jgi:hypothetical protein
MKIYYKSQFKKNLLSFIVILCIDSPIYASPFSDHYTLSDGKINKEIALASIGIIGLILCFPKLHYYYNSYSLQHQLEEYYGDKESVTACLNVYGQWWKGDKNIPILLFVGNQAHHAFRCFVPYITNYKKQECDSKAINFFDSNYLVTIAFEREKILFLIDTKNSDSYLP